MKLFLLSILFLLKIHLDDQSYGGGGGGGYLQGGSPFSASGSPGGGQVSRAETIIMRNRIKIIYSGQRYLTRCDPSPLCS